ncbi:DUF3108 domain-containing protein [Vulcaniibacterium tengchongense]|uniref:Uncharacterized protein DUF3108 n=1 Tax=Vulcaniibacterium tengchongense TaxID=1273429 RepID=A0A3N4VVE4_9GAMM|nr:DUF3108 domain-containing protein [Vulcaniibacterium tengchongense]RPE81027.1 uncharacterized protein DUF3108 [Vulcaniibacterium tengchongense]
MRKLVSFVAMLLLGAACTGPARALEPFVANYQVLRGGEPLGEATMQVAREGENRWRVDLGMRGTTGLFGLAGVNAQQSTSFEVVGEAYRPLTQTTVRKAVFMGRKIEGVYDWSSRTARWSGDVKKTRRAPVPLQDGDMSGLLINLAIVRDAQPGKQLRYRFVDNGRARDHHYTVAPELEGVVVDGMGFNAMRVSRMQGGAEETVVWVVDGVPTPVRILQRDDGKDTFDLRLVDYKGAP